MTRFNPERFSQAWAIGKIGENAFKEQCKLWDMTILFEAPANQVFYPYDFLIQYNATHEKEKYPNDIIELPEPVKWEIKCDMGKTGNIPVQFHSSSKLTVDKYLPNSSLSCNAGIYRTESSLYCVFNPHDEIFYIAPSNYLRDYLEKTPGIKKILANRHKPEQTGIALIPKQVWLKQFYKLPYTPDDYS